MGRLQQNERGRGSKHHNRRVRSGEQNGGPPPSVLRPRPLLLLRAAAVAAASRPFLAWPHPPQATMMCGAERRTAMVVMMVKAVKVMRQNRSITIAANCTRAVQGQGEKEVGLWPPRHLAPFQYIRIF